jgi:hypothetical protein
VQQQGADQAAYKYSIQLLVPPGQLELGKRLITAMYSSSPDLSDLTTQQLLQLALLADCYVVGSVAAAVGNSLSSRLSASSMSLDTAAAVVSLPDGCLNLQAFSGAHSTAASKLQQELGDLEVVWGGKDKQQALLGLPLGALLVLLRDGRTQVFKEDTAVYTAGRWMKEHPGTSSQQQRQLVDVLRLPHCTPTYLVNVVAPAASWLRGAGLTEAEALQLCALPPDAGKRQVLLKEALGHKAAWQQLARPDSTLQTLKVELKLPVADLEGAVKEKTSVDTNHEGSLVVWSGRRWGLRTTAAHDCLGVFLAATEVPAGSDGQCCLRRPRGPGPTKEYTRCWVPSRAVGRVGCPAHAAVGPWQVMGRRQGVAQQGEAAAHRRLPSHHLHHQPGTLRLSRPIVW